MDYGHHKLHNMLDKYRRSLRSQLVNAEQVKNILSGGAVTIYLLAEEHIKS